MINVQVDAQSMDWQEWKQYITAMKKKAADTGETICINPGIVGYRTTRSYSRGRRIR